MAGKAETSEVIDERAFKTERQLREEKVDWNNKHQDIRAQQV